MDRRSAESHSRVSDGRLRSCSQAGVDVLSSGRNTTLAAQRAAERKAREDRAPRLSRLVPQLRTLRLVIEDKFPLGVTKHTRHIMVDRAPALFVVPCGGPECDSEGHDITAHVMSALQQRLTRAEGDHPCDGAVGSARCGRSVHFVVAAEYQPG